MAATYTQLTPDKAVRATLKFSTLVGILMCIAGLVSIGMPFLAGITVNFVIAGVLIFSGFGHLFYGWHLRQAGAAFWEIVQFWVMIGAGGYLLYKPLVALSALTLTVAIVLVIMAILELGLYFRMRSKRGAGWLIFNGALTLILGGMIWASWPTSSEWAVGTLAGTCILFSGVSRTMLAATALKMVG